MNSGNNREMNNLFLNKLICADSLRVLNKIGEDSIDIVLTDPPYFLDKLDNQWDHKVASSKKYQHTVKSLPAGMKFDREQGARFYNWYLEVSKEIFRVLKPGRFFFSFSSPRLYHRMASAVDDAGFELRDCFLWVYTQNQAKAMSLDHFIDKLKADQKTKDALKSKLKGWKTPQIKSCFEPIVMAQKKPEGTFLENMVKNEVGLFNTTVRIGDNMFPSNILTIENINEIMDKNFLIKKPNKNEKSGFNNHMTVKPLLLCEYLLRLSVFSRKGTVLDPFMGSGTTLVAAKNLGLNYVGIDSNPEYVEIAKKRLERSQKLLF